MATTEFSVASILDSISSTIGSITDEEIASSSNSKAISDIFRAEQASQEAAAKDAGTVKASEQAGIMQQQQRVASVMDAMNFDSLSVELATQLGNSGEKLAQLQESISKKNSVGFLDNPLMWLGAQLSAQPDIEAYNAEAGKFNLIESRSKAVNDMSQEVAATSRAALSTVTADSAAAASRLAGVEHNSAARQAAIKALANDTAELRNLRENSLQKIALEADGRRTLDAAEDQARQREAFAMQKESHTLSMANARAAAAKEGKEVVFEQKMLHLINVGAQHVGRRPFSNLDDYKLFERSNKGNAEVAQRLSEIGYNVLEKASTNKAGSVRLGEQSGDVAKLLVESRGTLRQAPAIDKLLKNAHLTAVSGNAAIGTTAIDPKNTAAVSAYTTRAVTAKATADARNVSRGGADNIYAPPTFAEMIATTGSADKFPPLYKKLFAESVKANPMQQADPAMMYHKTVEALLAGKVTLNEATDGLKELAEAAVGTNNALRNYSAVAIPTQKSYGTSTKLHSTAFFESNIELTNRTELYSKLALATALSRQAQSYGTKPYIPF